MHTIRSHPIRSDLSYPILTLSDRSDRSDPTDDLFLLRGTSYDYFNIAIIVAIVFYEHFVLIPVLLFILIFSPPVSFSQLSIPHTWYIIPGITYRKNNTRKGNKRSEQGRYKLYQCVCMFSQHSNSATVIFTFYFDLLCLFRCCTTTQAKANNVVRSRRASNTTRSPKDKSQKKKRSPSAEERYSVNPFSGSSSRSNSSRDDSNIVSRHSTMSPLQAFSLTSGRRTPPPPVNTAHGNGDGPIEPASPGEADWRRKFGLGPSRWVLSWNEGVGLVGVR